ncbi:MAG: TfoX/Sxy family protein [Chitinophagaceae bacterium]
MAYDEHLEERINLSLKRNHIAFEGKKMFGGLAYMINEKMCVGILKNSLMAKIDPAQQAALLKKRGARVMDFTGRVAKGMVIIDPEGIDLDKDLDYWIDIAVEYNKIAKATKKKKVTKK